MSIKNLRYWVFTSGENGIHGLDWGIKHASEYFSDRQQLDTDYRALLKDFGVPPSLERPTEGVGLILLNWKREDFIAGFIFAGTDHGDRPNTSSVISVIPSELIGKKSVNEVIKDIWTKNNIAEIASKNSQCRPDTLRLEGGRVFSEDVPYFKSSVSWPSYYNGWLQIDGKQRELLSVNAPDLPKEVKPSSGGKLKGILLVLMVVAVACGVYRYFIASSGIVESTPAIKEQNEGVASADLSPTGDHTNQNGNHAPENGEEERTDVDVLRKTLTLLLKGGGLKVKGKSFTVRVSDWDDDKEKRFNKCSVLKGISLKPAGSKGKSIEFSLRSRISEDATINECIEAFLNQITKETR